MGNLFWAGKSSFRLIFFPLLHFLDIHFLRSLHIVCMRVRGVVWSSNPKILAGCLHKGKVPLPTTQHSGEALQQNTWSTSIWIMAYLERDQQNRLGGVECENFQARGMRNKRALIFLESSNILRMQRAEITSRREKGGILKLIGDKSLPVWEPAKLARLQIQRSTF